jgi:hypothetical protein
MKRTLFPITAAVCMAALVFLSCATQGDTQGGTQGGRQANLLPLSNGWYQYDSERTFKGIEDEYTMSQSLGVKVVQEVTYKYTGVVTNFAGGALYDPVTGIELLIDSKGNISCAENVSIRGAVNRNGSFQWNGFHTENGRLNSIFVKGTLTPLPASVRAGPAFDGVYHMTDQGTGRRQLVKISSGFYTWAYLGNEEAPFTPWPTLIHPDGAFSFSMDITTVMEMGEASRMHFTNGFLSQGKVIPGQGISMEEVVRSAGLASTGLGNDQRGRPQVYSGTAIRSGEFPNEAIPADIDSLIQNGRSTARAAPKPDRANYPPWYLNLPSKAGFICAAGEKTFADRETAFAMAEAAAAAYLADQIMVRIQSTATEVSNNAGTRIEEHIRNEALQRLKYRVVERTYNEKTSTAFVLLEMEM